MRTPRDRRRTPRDRVHTHTHTHSHQSRFPEVAASHPVPTLLRHLQHKRRQQREIAERDNRRQQLTRQLMSATSDSWTPNGLYGNVNDGTEPPPARVEADTIDVHGPGSVLASSPGRHAPKNWRIYSRLISGEKRSAGASVMRTFVPSAASAPPAGMRQLCVGPSVSRRDP